MSKSAMVIPAVLLIGIVLGLAASHVIGAAPADAQINIGAFKPVAVSSSMGDRGAVAWFIGADGSARVCISGQGNSAASCQPVRFP